MLTKLRNYKVQPKKKTNNFHSVDNIKKVKNRHKVNAATYIIICGGGGGGGGGGGVFVCVYVCVCVCVCVYEDSLSGKNISAFLRFLHG